MRVYQVLNKDKDDRPGMLVYVDSHEQIRATQSDPNNPATYKFCDPMPYSPSDYAYVYEPTVIILSPEDMRRIGEVLSKGVCEVDE